MRQRTITILAGIAAALQTAAVLLAVFMVENQSVVMRLWGGLNEAVSGEKIFPTGAFIELLLPLPIYVIFLLCIAAIKTKPSQRRVLAVAFTVLVVLFKIMAAVMLVPFCAMLQARLRGALAFAGYSTLTQAVSQATLLFTATAFALFCMAAGSCLPVMPEPASCTFTFPCENKKV